MTSEEFEEHIRRECIRILRAVHNQQFEDVEARVTGLCELAADRQAQRRKQDGSAGADPHFPADPSLSSGSAEAGSEGRDRVVKRLRRIALIANPKDPNNHYYETLFANHPPVQTPADVRNEVMNCEGLPPLGAGDYIHATYTDGSRDIITLAESSKPESLP
jgi:hypothetical protein